MKIGKEKLEALLKAVLAARWHNPERRDWMAALLTIFVVEAELARSRRPGAAAAAERIAWTFGEMVKDPAETLIEAAEHQAHLQFQPADINEPTPVQQAEDDAQLNALAKQLLEAFGVQAALLAAFPRMQLGDVPFNAPDIWDRWWKWMRETFFNSQSN